jgi:hypothetical protein
MFSFHWCFFIDTFSQPVNQTWVFFPIASHHCFLFTDTLRLILFLNLLTHQEFLSHSFPSLFSFHWYSSINTFCQGVNLKWVFVP